MPLAALFALIVIDAQVMCFAESPDRPHHALFDVNGLRAAEFVPHDIMQVAFHQHYEPLKCR